MTVTTEERLLLDYTRWHHLQVATGDLDPVYPVLRRLADDLTLDDDARAWLCVLHVTYYHLGSALAAFARLPYPAAPTRAGDLLHLPCGTERRGHRVPQRLYDHWCALLDTLDAAGGPHAWLTALGDASPTDGWGQLNDRIAAVHGNGRWAAYKLAELAQKVCGARVQVADAGHRNSSGPRHGLALLFPWTPSGNGPDVIADLDRLTAALAADLGEPDLGQVETSLCDFHGLVSGRYYLGHDIDLMAEQLAAVPSALTLPAIAARLGALPFAYLAEVGGWPGVDRARKRAYADSGVIVARP